MPHAKFGLTAKELAQVERGHREMMELANSPPVRMALQVGITRSINGKTYTLNEHHRWTRKIPKVGGGGQSQPTEEQHYHGLATWVDQYKQTRAAGNVKLAKQIRGNIESAIKKNKLDPGRVWGKDPGKQAVDKRYGSDVAPKQPSPPQSHSVNVESDDNHDGITDAARVGVPAFWVPPPPKQIPRIDGLNPMQQKVEGHFARAFERNADAMTQAALHLFAGDTKPGDPITFETDAAKKLSPHWNSHKLAQDLQQRAINRANFNVALHQTANAITKRAFLQHLDTLDSGAEILVTVGGCGAGKGYSLNNVPEAMEAKKRSAAVWDSAGDQNATENPWILAEASKRNLKVTYIYVSADPHKQWADPERGVVKRARDPKDGRMVDAKVFADSYAIGAKNHQAFFEHNRENPNCQFMFLQNKPPPTPLPGIPQESLQVDRHELEAFAVNTIKSNDSIPYHVKFGALNGQTLWKD